MNADLLADARGRVSCSRCKGSFNALRHLSDEFPDDRYQGPKKPPGKAPPVLGDATAFDLEDALAEATTEAEAPDSDELSPRTWQTLTIALIVLTLINLAWIFTGTIMGRDGVQDFLARHDLPGAPVEEDYRDPGKIHLVSRDIHPHPSRTGVLVLSSTFVNLAERAQPYPDVTLSLMNEDNAALAQRTFSPGDYLPGGLRPEQPLQPGTHVPILLEFADPGEDAVGFELEFF